MKKTQVSGPPKFGELWDRPSQVGGSGRKGTDGLVEWGGLI